MFKIISYTKSTDDNAYFIELNNNGNKVIVKTRSYKVKLMHKKAFIKRDIQISGECNYQELFDFLVSNIPLFLYYVPEEYIHDKMIDEAIVKDGDVLSIIDKGKRTLARCIMALNENGLCYRFLPKEFKSVNTAFIAVSNNGLALKHVDPHHREYDVCIRAVYSDLRAIRFVPGSMLEHILYDLYTTAMIDEETYGSYCDELKLNKKL